MTDEGARFYHSILPLLGQLEETVENAGKATALVRGRLRVNVDAHFSRLVLTPKLGTFLARYPELSVELLARPDLGDLAADGFDLAVRFGEPEPSSLVARKLFDVRVITCAAPSYLARRGKPAHPATCKKNGTSTSSFATP